MAKPKNDKGLTYCRTKVGDELRSRGKLIKTTSCPVCDFHVRGKNHTQGSHHNNSAKAIQLKADAQNGIPVPEKYKKHL